MAYEKLNIQDGWTLDETMLGHMEDGIFGNSENVDTLTSDVEVHGETIGEYGDRLDAVEDAVDVLYGSGTGYSILDRLERLEAVYAGTFTAQPQDVTAAANDNAVFSVTVKEEIAANVSYQWQVLNRNGAWQNVSTGTGQRSVSYTIQATIGRNNAKYRCVVTCPDGYKAASDAATLTVTSESQTSGTGETA